MKSRDLLPLVSTAFRLVGSGIEHYQTLSDLNPDMRHAAVTIFLRAQIQDWNPEIGGTQVVNDEARDDLASFVARVSLALGQVAEKGAA
jgi:hypothetical protein